jgi:hypothetical protein
MNSVELIVCVHDTAYLSFLDGRLKGGKIYLPKRTLPYHYIWTAMSVELRVAGDVMLYNCAYTLTLHALDVSYRNPRDQKRILPEVLEVAAIHGHTIDVDSRSQKNIESSRSRVLSDLRSHLRCQ